MPVGIFNQLQLSLTVDYMTVMCSTSGLMQMWSSPDSQHCACLQCGSNVDQFCKSAMQINNLLWKNLCKNVFHACKMGVNAHILIPEVLFLLKSTCGSDGCVKWIMNIAYTNTSEKTLSTRVHVNFHRHMILYSIFVRFQVNFCMNLDNNCITLRKAIILYYHHHRLRLVILTKVNLEKYKMFLEKNKSTIIQGFHSLPYNSQ